MVSNKVLIRWHTVASSSAAAVSSLVTVLPVCSYDTFHQCCTAHKCVSPVYE